jgi:soluble lytic murein transglycosylase-like protein
VTATIKNIFVIALFAVLALAADAQPVRAQIYSWRDANGVLTLSDRPQGSSARAVKVPVDPAVKVTIDSAPRLLAPPPARQTSYEPLIQHHAGLRGIRAALIRAVIQIESAFNPRAVSPKGAMGLMQLMPATAREFGVLDPFNPAENIRAGVSYLRQLLDRYNHNEHLALAAYNAGPRAVEKYGNQIPPYKETQNYVRKISGTSGTTRSGPEGKIYKVTELVNGQLVIRYTNTKPADGQYQVVSR